jgi:histone H3/H4
MNHWKPCSSCKKEIGFDAKYYECSVSTCTGLRTGYVFCSVQCWERHVPGAKHRDAAAVQRRIIASSAPSSSAISRKDENEILVVVSKVKAYIKSQADMNVSDEIMDILSHRIRYFCDQAIKHAQADGRKTIQDKDMKV